MSPEYSQAEMDIWVPALKAYGDEDFEKSITLFQKMSNSPTALFNIGLIYATIGEYEAAVEGFDAAIFLGPHLAIAHFQRGVSNFLLQRYEIAFKDFDWAHLYLGGNIAVDYKDFGLKFFLYSAEVLFNKGLCQIYLGNVQEGLEFMRSATVEKTTEEHEVIYDAIADQGEDYTVFSIPVGVIYSPRELELKKYRNGVPTYVSVNAPVRVDSTVRSRDHDHVHVPTSRNLLPAQMPEHVEQLAEEPWVFRIKFYYGDDIRGLKVTSETTLEEFVGRVCTKLGRPYGSLAFVYKDKNRTMTLLRDVIDFNIVLGLAQPSESDYIRTEPAEVWCTDK